MDFDTAMQALADASENDAVLLLTLAIHGHDLSHFDPRFHEYLAEDAVRALVRTPSRGVVYIPAALRLLDQASERTPEQLVTLASLLEAADVPSVLDAPGARVDQWLATVASAPHTLIAERAWAGGRATEEVRQALLHTLRQIRSVCVR